MVDKEKINGYFLEAVRRLKAEGYTQKAIVEAACLSQNAISKIKTGQANAGDDTINKLCTAFKLNPDFFYHDSQQFKLGDKECQVPNVPIIDPSSYINSLIAEHTAYVNRLTDDLKKKEIEMQERLAEKDARIVALERTIADKETIIKDRNARIDALERQLSAVAKTDIDSWPFSVGVADEGDRLRSNI